MPAVFFDGMLVNNIVSIVFKNEPCYSLGEVCAIHRMFSSQGFPIAIGIILQFPFRKAVD